MVLSNREEGGKTKIAGFVLIGISIVLLSFLLGRLSIEKDVEKTLKKHTEDDTKHSNKNTDNGNR